MGGGGGGTAGFVFDAALARLQISPSKVAVAGRARHSHVRKRARAGTANFRHAFLQPLDRENKKTSSAPSPAVQVLHLPASLAPVHSE